MANFNHQKKALVTGAAGFIGFHISKKLIDEGWLVVGLDSMSDYYDVSLKRAREAILLKNTSYKSLHKKIEEPHLLLNIFAEERPDVVIHLAAQAGVRNSIDNPRAYLNSNIIGTFELLEAARAYRPEHILLASSSSAYGANKEMPYRETVKADHQLSFYAATKKSTENMAHSYSYLFNLPITAFRFFTVYGPWGRPDMAYFKFTKAIINGEPIDVYNGGQMSRDFTYIDDLVLVMKSLLGKVPDINKRFNKDGKPLNNTSKVAPFRLINIGNGRPETLTDFIEAIEHAIGMPAVRNWKPMQASDVPTTWADTSFLEQTIGYSPKTKLSHGLKKFVEWYVAFYEIGKYSSAFPLGNLKS